MSDRFPGQRFRRWPQSAEEEHMSLHDPHTPDAAGMNLAALEKSYLAEVRAERPDMARMHALRAAITSARRRIERANGVLPPHTD
jgi:hypothetical protein